MDKRKKNLPIDYFIECEPSLEVLLLYPWAIKIWNQFNYGAWMDDHLHEIGGVTHWMILPEEPKD